MMFETVHERLARLYPLHFQTIVERIHEEYFIGRYDGADIYLNCRASKHELACAFHWDRTPEGADYWNRLSQAEDVV